MPSMAGMREIGCDLDRHRRVLAVQVGKGLLLGLELASRLAERLFRLQVAQALGVRRGNVDGDVGGARVDGAQAGEIVVGGARVRRVEVLADVEAQDAAPLRAGRVGEEPLDAVVVEAEPVDRALRLRQPEEARLRVAGLRARRDGAALDEAEPERGESVDVRGVLVESGGEPDPVGELEPHRRDRRRRAGAPRAPARSRSGPRRRGSRTPGRARSRGRA